MAVHQDEQDVSTNQKTAEAEASAENPSAAETQPFNNTRPSIRRKSSCAAIVACLLSLIALAGSGYTLYELQRISLQQHRNQDFILHEASSLRVYQQRLAELFKHFKYTVKQTLLEQQQAQAHDTNRFALMKASYYLELAHIHAKLQDKQQTLALLQEAYTLLQRTSEPQIAAIGQTLLQEINELQAHPNPDLINLEQQLSVLQANIPNLTFKNAAFSPINANTAPQAKSETDLSGYTHWQRSLNALKQLIVVRHDDQGDTQILSPLYQNMIKESLILYLQTAQWALLQNNMNVFHQSICQAKQRIQRYFITNQPDTTQMLQALEALQKIQITPLPTENQAFQQLKKYLQSSSASPRSQP